MTNWLVTAVVFCITVRALFTASASAEPVKSLAVASTGHIEFESVTPPRMSLFIRGGGQDPPATVSGDLSLPEGASGKVPAVVYLHTSGGYGGREAALWRQRFLGWGLAFFSIDSYTPRGIKSGIPAAHLALQVADAYAALRLLATDPAIDRERIFIAGSSLGALSAFETTIDALASRLGGGARFAGGFGFYPAPCGLRFVNTARAKTPFLWFAAEKEDWADPKWCKAYIDSANASGADARLFEMKGAYHGFDQLGVSRIDARFTNEAKCNMEVDMATLTIRRVDTGELLRDPAAINGYYGTCVGNTASLVGDEGTVRAVEMEIRKFLTDSPNARRP